MSDVRMVASGQFTDLLAWELTAGGPALSYTTLLRIFDADGTLENYGMGGPTVYDHHVINVAVGYNPERAFGSCVARSTFDVHRVAAVFDDSTEADLLLAHVNSEDGLRFWTRIPSERVIKSLVCFSGHGVPIETLTLTTAE